MDSPLPSNNLSAQFPGLTGFLSSLGSMMSGNAATAGMFANLLEQSQNMTPVPPQPSTSAPQNALSQNDSDGDSFTGNQTSGALENIVSGLRHIIYQLSGRNSGNAPQNQAQTGNTNTQTVASDTTSATNQTQPPQNGPNASGSTTTNTPSSTGDSNSSNGNTPDAQTLAHILSELVILMQMIEKKLELAQSATGGGTGSSSSLSSSSTGSTSPTDPATLANILAQLGLTPGGSTSASDPSSSSGGDTGSGQTGAADPLTQLLGLIQSMEQKLALSSSDAIQAAGPATSGGTALTAASTSAATNSLLSELPDLFQIQKDLKGLMGALQNAMANNNPSNDAAGTTGNSTNTTISNDLSSTIKTTDLSQTGKPAQDLAGNLFDFFNDTTANIFGAPSPAANVFAPVNAGSLISGDQNGGLLDTGDQNNGAASSGGNTGNAGGLNANNTVLPTLTDGTKSADPYSFASQLSATRAMNGGTTGLPSAVEQVLLQLNRGVKNGDDQLSIQLQPADLGKINVKLDISADGKVQGTVVADNPATLHLLLKDVRSLERALQEAGLRANSGSLQFSLGGQSGNTSGQTANNFAGNTSSSNNTSSGTADTSLDVSADTGEAWIVTPGRVNFKV